MTDIQSLIQTTGQNPLLNFQTCDLLQDLRKRLSFKQFIQFCRNISFLYDWEEPEGFLKLTIKDRVTHHVQALERVPDKRRFIIEVPLNDTREGMNMHHRSRFIPGRYLFDLGFKPDAKANWVWFGAYCNGIPRINDASLIPILHDVVYGTHPNTPKKRLQWRFTKSKSDVNPYKCYPASGLSGDQMLAAAKAMNPDIDASETVDKPKARSAPQGSEAKALADVEKDYSEYADPMLSDDDLARMLVQLGHDPMIVKQFLTTKEHKNENLVSNTHEQVAPAASPPEGDRDPEDGADPSGHSHSEAEAGSQVPPVDPEGLQVPEDRAD